MQAVKDILQAHGYESAADMDVGESVKVELDSEAMMPLVVEKVADNRVSVAHYYEQRGDLMRDPEIVFRVEANGEWTAVQYRQDPYIHRKARTGLVDAQSFAEKQWSKNLQEQGYVEAAARAASSSPAEVTA